MSNAIITGASRGLGRALAEDLITRGWQVIVDGRDASALDAACDDLGSRAIAIPGDVTDSWHRAELVRAAESIGGLDLLVNNASALGPSPQPRLRDYPIDVFESIYQVNVLAPLALVQATLPLLAASGGAIIIVTSDAAVEPYEGWGGYGSSKAAHEQLSHELAAEEPDVRVWWFDPGDMRTQMHQEAFPGEDISDRPLPETVVPAVIDLLDRRPASGRVRAADLLVGSSAR
jgi:NAD(P)-dependent dehydrogenase (short-subunit alcohol dehydrogenase family)